MPDQIPFEWTQQTVAAEHDRRKNNKAEVRRMLEDGQRHTTRELMTVGGLRVGARVAEIRESAVVHRYAMGRGEWAFRLDPSGVVDPECDHCPRCLIPIEEVRR